MTIRFSARPPTMPTDEITYVDLATLTLKDGAQLHGWGVRIPHKKAAERQAAGKPGYEPGTVVRVLKMSGAEDSEVLLKRVHGNAQFTYWTTKNTARSGALR